MGRSWKRAQPQGPAPRQFLTRQNQNHWVRDVTLTEDASRIRVNPGIMARLRSQTLNISRANGVTNIAEACSLRIVRIKADLHFSALNQNFAGLGIGLVAIFHCSRQS